MNIKALIKGIYKVLFRKIDRSFFWNGDTYSDHCISENVQWKCYAFLKREYATFLQGLPKYGVSPDRAKVIWWCWLQGEENAPDLCKICLASIKKELPEYEVRIITNDNLCEYIELPEYILDKQRQGLIGGAHFSDIIRLELLVKYGGIWMDSTVFCSGSQNTDFLSEPFFVFQNWKFNQEHAALASNWFIVSNKEHPILKTTLDLLLEYWLKNDSAIDYYIFHFFFHLAANRYPELWASMPRYSNIPPHILQFELFEQYSSKRFQQITTMSDFHKLNRRAEALNKDIDNTYYKHLKRSLIVVND